MPVCSFNEISAKFSESAPLTALAQGNNNTPGNEGVASSRTQVSSRFGYVLGFDEAVGRHRVPEGGVGRVDHKNAHNDEIKSYLGQASDNN